MDGGGDRRRRRRRNAVLGGHVVVARNDREGGIARARSVSRRRIVQRDGRTVHEEEVVERTEGGTPGEE